MAWEENSGICLNMQLIAILSRIGVNINCCILNDKGIMLSVKGNMTELLQAQL